MSQTTEFLSASSKSQALMPVNLTTSPRLATLKSHEGVEMKDRQRTNMASGVVVNVEQSKLQNWSLSAVLRELAQNVSDACIKTISPPKNGIMSWRTENSPTGARLFLNDSLAGEWFAMHEPAPKTKGITLVNLFFYNRGCVLIEDAFQPGSYKCQTNSYIAGGPGLGLKDLIGLVFHNSMQFESFSAVTYHPQGVIYGGHKDAVFFRMFELQRTQIAKDHGYSYFQGNYGLNISDSVSPPTTTQKGHKPVPTCVQSLLTALQREKASAGTVIWLQKLVPNVTAGNEQVRLLKEASLQHIFLYGDDKGSNYTKMKVYDPSYACENILLLFTESQPTFRVFLYPGLLYAQTSFATKLFESKLGIIFAAKLIPTNRDRINSFTDQISGYFGSTLIAQMQKEYTEKKFAIHANKLEQSGKLTNHQTIVTLLQTLDMKISFLVISQVCHDLMNKKSTLSVISKGLIDFVNGVPSEYYSTNGTYNQKYTNKTFITDFIGTRLFGKFEKVRTKTDQTILEAIVTHSQQFQNKQKSQQQVALKNGHDNKRKAAVALQEEDEEVVDDGTGPPKFLPPMLISGHQELNVLFGGTTFDSILAIERYLVYLLSLQTSTWSPQKPSLQATWTRVCTLSETKSFVAYSLDIPLLLLNHSYVYSSGDETAGGWKKKTAKKEEKITITANNLDKFMKFLTQKNIFIFTKQLTDQIEQDDVIAIKTFERIAAHNTSYLKRSLEHSISIEKKLDVGHEIAIATGTAEGEKKGRKKGRKALTMNTAADLQTAAVVEIDLLQDDDEEEEEKNDNKSAAGDEKKSSPSHNTRRTRASSRILAQSPQLPLIPSTKKGKRDIKGEEVEEGQLVVTLISDDEDEEKDSNSSDYDKDVLQETTMLMATTDAVDKEQEQEGGGEEEVLPVDQMSQKKIIKLKHTMKGQKGVITDTTTATATTAAYLNNNNIHSPLPIQYHPDYHHDNNVVYEYEDEYDHNGNNEYDDNEYDGNDEVEDDDVVMIGDAKLPQQKKKKVIKLKRRVHRVKRRSDNAIIAITYPNSNNTNKNPNNNPHPNPPAPAPVQYTGNGHNNNRYDDYDYVYEYEDEFEDEYVDDEVKEEENDDDEEKEVKPYEYDYNMYSTGIKVVEEEGEEGIKTPVVKYEPLNGPNHYPDHGPIDLCHSPSTPVVHPKKKVKYAIKDEPPHNDLDGDEKDNKAMDKSKKGDPKQLILQQMKESMKRLQKEMNILQSSIDALEKSY